MHRSVRVFLFLVACLTLVGAFFFWNQYVSTRFPEFSTVHLKEQTVKVTVADTPESRERGLSGRSELAPDEGMLFVFPEDGHYAFWMKDMRFAIDIVWISYSEEIVDVEEKVSPETYPAVFTPRRPARYVLELPSGFVEEHDVTIGDTVRF